MGYDSYLTISAPSQGLFKDRKSRFIGLAFPISNEDSFKKILKELRKKYNDASHYCYAYILGLQRNKFHSGDDGEPANTAGVQILRQINSKQLTNVLVVVVRYFGGIKLGLHGLINAYRTASLEALNNAEIITEFEKSHFKICFKYPQMNIVMNLLKKYNAEIIKQNFELACSIEVKIQKCSEMEFIKSLTRTGGIKLEPVNLKNGIT
ncbi:MAG: YigZ family protein [Bacteroidetes bacterium CG23_combo_of_CG06-09_8_20_14_all_32_9]|nr:MAG: YigZ family protein [Bacteroidetes bacterium CG23_combo_of_CG06-09_8_20_14_all_32_9]